MATSASQATRWREILRGTRDIEKVRLLLAGKNKFANQLPIQIREKGWDRLGQVKTREDLNKLVCKEKEKVEEGLQSAALAQAKLDSERLHGPRKAGQALQSALVTFSKFLESYSGIVEVVKLADQQYGGLAYSILSVFLIVVVNKSEQENRLCEYLTEFSGEQDRLSRIQSLSPTESMTILLVNVYVNILEFVKRATLYYERTGIGKLFYIAFHPPKRYLDTIRNDILRDSEQMYREMSIRSAEQTNQISTRQDEERAYRNRNAVLDLRPYFGNVVVSADEIHRYQAALKDPGGTGKKYTQFDFSKLSNNPDYLSWKTSTHSGLFLLKGKTLNTRTGFSWLSPAALDVLSLVQTETEWITTYCLAGTSGWMEEDSRAQASLIISRIIWQLLEKKPDFIGDPDRLRSVQDRIQSENWTQTCPTLPCDLLIEFLAEFPKTYIIVDRIDRCQCYPVNFIDQLFRVVKESQKVVKIFVVLCESLARGFDDEALDRSGVEDKCYIVTLDQRPKLEIVAIDVQQCDYRHISYDS